MGKVAGRDLNDGFSDDCAAVLVARMCCDMKGVHVGFSVQ